MTSLDEQYIAALIDIPVVSGNILNIICNPI